jgi:predicted ATPase
MAANPNAQFIIATHSPEIIGMFEDRTIEISPRKTANAQI